MVDYFAFLGDLYNVAPAAVYLLVILLVALIVYKIITAALKRILFSRAKTKKQRSNTKVFLSLWRYAFVIVIIMGLLFYMGGDMTGLGIWAGLMTAAIGWALQKPITGIAGWLMIIVKKPFHIGDRILIGNVKGDVVDITLTHIYLKEIGGTIGGEETSGRIVMIPNSVLFEQNIINYTLQDDFILDQVVIAVTYESNLDRAMKICDEATRKITKPFMSEMPNPPYIRTFFQPSGIDVKTRYYVKAAERIKIISEITQEINRNIKKAKDITIAYPHTEVVLRKRMPK